MSTTFRPLGEVAEYVVMKTAFLRALDEWTGRPESQFPRSCPPIHALKDPQSDESAELAAVFIRLCRLSTTTERMTLLTADILVHERRYDMACDLAELQPYREMIEVLRDWLEALFDRACEL